MNKNITYFLIENANETKKKVREGISASALLYGGIQFEEREIGKILNPTIKNILSIPKGSPVVIIRPKFALILRLLGKKAILINVNSNNYDLKIKKGLKNKIRYIFNWISFKSCNKIVCLSKTQLPKLKKLKIDNCVTIPFGADYEIIKKFKVKYDYLISAGADRGRNHEYVKTALKEEDLIILGKHNFLPYRDYLSKMAGAKALVLNIEMNEYASDLSGSSTCFEALLLKKPIFINSLPWLKELLKDNYYVYSNEKDLKKLVKKKIKFKERNYDYLKLEYFANKLEQTIKEICMNSNNLKILAK